VLPHLLDWIAGAFLAWLITHLYYRRSQADAELMRAAVQKAIREGLVEAERNAAGKISGLRRPLPPTDLRVR
jgi:hypothetical protein